MKKVAQTLGMASSAMILLGLLGTAPPAFAEDPNSAPATTLEASDSSSTEQTIPAGRSVEEVPAPMVDAAGSEDNRVLDGTNYPGNPELEAALVADEDRRLTEIRTVASMVRWRNLDVDSAYRLATGSSYSLVLTSRDEPYTVSSLLELAPQTFVRQPDGSFLLSEHIVIQNGATLDLSAPGGLELRMGSDSQGFVSIVNYGGTMRIRGSEAAKVRISSWDRDNGALDNLTDDGRAYIRSIGGQVAFSHVEFDHLGFWSGRTGGVSLTGTDRPSTGTLATFGRALKAGVEKLNSEQAKGTPAPTGGHASDGVLPAGELPLPEADLDDPTYSYVSASIEQTKLSANAFGLFIANANGVEISRTVVEDSLVDGIVMHRYVTNAALGHTESRNNAGDGFVLSRATTGIVLSEVVAEGNRRNGISIEGQPLANGPSATGIALGSYGNNSVSNSVSANNGRYGIEVIGGENVGVHANNVSGNEMGIVVRKAAEDVRVVGNRVEDNASQGIALRDLVSNATVAGNIIDGGETGIYVRGSVAAIGRNTLTNLTNHGISIVGSAAGTLITDNNIAGTGPSAIDVRRADRIETSGNVVDLWNDTTPWLIVLKNFFQPLTVLWLLLAMVVIVTAVKGHGRKKIRQHPYSDKAPLQSFTTTVSDLSKQPTRHSSRTGAHRARATEPAYAGSPEVNP